MKIVAKYKKTVPYKTVPLMEVIFIPETNLKTSLVVKKVHFDSS